MDDLPIQFVEPEDFEHLRPVFEKTLGSDAYGWKRSRKGTYVNPSRARDWRMFLLGYQTAMKEKA